LSFSSLSIAHIADAFIPLQVYYKALNR